MQGFSSGLELHVSNKKLVLSTGSPQLDKLIGGIQNGMFYLFYGEEHLIEKLFAYTITNALKSKGQRKPVVIYVLCGNYRRERTEIGIESLTHLAEAYGLTIEEAFKRIYIMTASSADQQTLVIERLERIFEKETDIYLVLVRGIFKLYNDDARIKNRHLVREEIQKSIIKMRQLCASRNISLMASGRESKLRRMLPLPESNSFLRHLANVIVYLRRRMKNSEYQRAFLLDHPAKPLASVEYAFKVNKELGRSTTPFRQSFQVMVDKLKKEFQDALLKVDRRQAFDSLVGVWSSELGAISFAESLKLIDLLLLLAVIDNRSLFAEQQESLQGLVNRISRIEKQLGLK